MHAEFAVYVFTWVRNHACKHWIFNGLSTLVPLTNPQYFQCVTPNLAHVFGSLWISHHERSMASSKYTEEVTIRANWGHFSWITENHCPSSMTSQDSYPPSSSRLSLDWPGMCIHDVNVKYHLILLTNNWSPDMDGWVTEWHGEMMNCNSFIGLL